MANEARTVVYKHETTLYEIDRVGNAVLIRATDLTDAPYRLTKYRASDYRGVLPPEPRQQPTAGQQPRCRRCGREFTPANIHQIYCLAMGCSVKVRRAESRRATRARIKAAKPPAKPAYSARRCTCGREFKPTSSTQRYCGIDACSPKVRRRERKRAKYAADKAEKELK